MAAKRAPPGLPPLKIGPLASDDDIQRAHRERADEQIRRMEALATRLCIPAGPDRWFLLALRLASEHVPELREEQSIGAPRKWHEYELAVLAAELERVKEAEGYTSNRAAARALCQRHPWSDLIGNQPGRGPHVSPDPAEALLAQYKAGKTLKWAHLARRVRDAELLNGSLDAWIKTVAMVGNPQAERGLDEFPWMKAFVPESLQPGK